MCAGAEVLFSNGPKPRPATVSLQPGAITVTAEVTKPSGPLRIVALRLCKNLPGLQMESRHHVGEGSP